MESLGRHYDGRLLDLQQEVAALLKIEPRYLRMTLRKISGKAPGRALRVEAH